MRSKYKSSRMVERLIRKSKFATQKEIAQKARMSASSFSMWLTGEQLTSDQAARRVGRVLEADVEHLLEALQDDRRVRKIRRLKENLEAERAEAGEERPIPLTNTDQFSKATGIIRIPVLMAIPAGGIVEIPEDLEKLAVEFEYLAADMVWDLHNLFALTVHGASMTHKEVADGDTIVVDTETEPKDGDLVLVRVSDTEGLLREIHYQNDLVSLESPTEPAIIVKPSELQLVGKVIRVIKSLE